MHSSKATWPCFPSRGTHTRAWALVPEHCPGAGQEHCPCQSLSTVPEAQLGCISHTYSMSTVRGQSLSTVPEAMLVATPTPAAWALSPRACLASTPVSCCDLPGSPTQHLLPYYHLYDLMLYLYFTLYKPIITMRDKWIIITNTVSMLFLLAVNCHRRGGSRWWAAQSPVDASLNRTARLHAHRHIYNIFAVTELNTVFSMILTTEPEEMGNGKW